MFNNCNKCNNCKNFHLSTNLTYVAGTSLTVATTNSTNITTKQPFCFVIRQKVSDTVTGTPVPVIMTVNGTAANLYNKYHLPMMSDKLHCRTLYKGWYVNNGTDAWVELKDIPKCECND